MSNHSWCQKRIRRTTHKCGVQLLTSVAHAKKLDEKNCNTLWMDVINRDMQNLKIAFDILECGAKIPVGCNKASDHLVFDVRMALERKSRWVKDGHRTPEPESSTFAGVVSRECFRISLTHASLTDLPVYSSNV